MKNGSDVRETPFKCRKTKVSEESSSDNDSTAIFHVTKTKFDANEPEWTKNCIQERNKLDLSPNNEAFYEIASKMSSKKSSIESSKNRCHESRRRRRDKSSRRVCRSRSSSDESSPHRYPKTGSNFSKIPTNLEIPDERINNLASVSSKTQKDTKPIKN